MSKRKNIGLLPLPTPDTVLSPRKSSADVMSSVEQVPPGFIPYSFFYPPVLSKQSIEHTYSSYRVEVIAHRFVELFRKYDTYENDRKVCNYACESVYKYFCFLLHLPVLKRYVTDLTKYAKDVLKCKAVVMGGFALRQWCPSHQTQDIDVKIFPLESNPNDIRFTTNESIRSLEDSIIAFTSQWQKDMALSPSTRGLVTYKDLAYTLEHTVMAPVTTYLHHHGTMMSSITSIDMYRDILEWIEHIRQTIQNAASMTYHQYLQCSRAPVTGVIKLSNPSFNIAVPPGFDPEEPEKDVRHVKAHFFVPMIDITVYDKNDETYEIITTEYNKISSRKTIISTPPTTKKRKWNINVPCVDWLIVENDVLIKKYTSIIANPSTPLKESQEASRFIEKFARTKRTLDAQQNDKMIRDISKRKCLFPSFW